MTLQKHPPRDVLSKTYSENLQQIYRRTPMPKCDLLKLHFGMGVLLQICCIFSEHLFLRTPLDGCFCSSLSVVVHEKVDKTLTRTNLMISSQLKKSYIKEITESFCI